MPIFMMVIQILSWLAPAIAKVMDAINGSMSGGIKGYDQLVQIALEQVKIVAREADVIGASQPGGPDSGWERNLRLYANAIYKTADAAEMAGIVFKDHQLGQAVADAVTAWKMESSPNSTGQTGGS